VAAVAALSLGALSGCIQNNKDYYGFDPDSQYKNRASPWATTASRRAARASGRRPPQAGQPRSHAPRLHDAGLPRPANLQPSDAQVLISLAVWRPQNTTEPLPVIIDAGPYFEVGSHCKVANQRPCAPGNMVDDTIDWAGQTTPFTVRNYLPRGYAVAQVAVRGTGTSGGCMDLMGPAEVHDLDQAITWLGTQPWSNGNVAMIGASYDGSTPWEVASTGNPHLKTIIPVSGLPDIYGLMFHNGSAETRGLTMHNGVYWGYGFSDNFPYSDSPVPIPDIPQSPVPCRSPCSRRRRCPTRGRPREANGRTTQQDLQNLACPKVAEGSAVAAASVATGSRAGRPTRTGRSATTAKPCSTTTTAACS